MSFDKYEKYDDWFQHNVLINSELFAEAQLELFEEFCLNMYQQRGSDSE